ncbi:hypothetical protein LV89_03622 [Arcicella aurantiaca]|uniref:FecR family protein n=1 Tax=Arcicella aurantiaca TaxID=591202 RepID=A0A316DWP7_9BACT|nr:hypothetical protein [Arcicella aurantiaca]PWK21908.1 hypothetical protein LV89_03622 [Arcicella aurantiaca]
MKNSENIDKIFSEGLQNYERQPRSEAWVKLQARLEKPQSKVLPLWWKFASAASVALLLGVGGYWYNSQKNTVNEDFAVVNQLKNTSKETTLPLQNTSKTESVAVTTTKETKIEVTKHNTKVLKFDSQNEISVSKISKSNEILNTKNIVSPTPLAEIKTTIEPNTIVLVLEDTKPKIQEETIVLNFVEAKPEAVAQIDPNEENLKKQSRLSKIWQQLKRAKNGEDVNWGEVGIKPQKVLARADAKIENALTKGENNEK